MRIPFLDWLIARIPESPPEENRWPALDRLEKELEKNSSEMDAHERRIAMLERQAEVIRGRYP